MVEGGRSISSPSEDPWTLEEKFIQNYGEVLRRNHDELVFQCPECHHKALSCNVAKGVVFCFHCGFGRGRKADPAASTTSNRPVIDRQLQLRVLEHVLDLYSISEEHRGYLAERGVYNPERYKIITVPVLMPEIHTLYSPKELVDSGLWMRSNTGLRRKTVLGFNRILIPYWWAGQVVGFKTRADPKEDSSPKYLIPLGFSTSKQPWLFGDCGKDLIVTEGELKAVAAYEVGLSAASVSGANNYKCVSLLKQHTAGVRRYFVVYDVDPDPEVRGWVGRHAQKVARLLGPNACVVTLPFDGKKSEVDSFLVTFGAPLFVQYLERCWYARKH